MLAANCCSKSPAQPLPLKRANVHAIKSPAKINLTLEVLGDLPGGYHQLDTVFATLDLADELRWRYAPKTQLVLLGTPSGMAVSEGEDNLVIQALRALEVACGRELSLYIELKKKIPAGGGLGGGSSNAAALLYGVNESHELGLTGEKLLELAATLGADVAFGIRGGIARGSQRGEQLQALPALAKPASLILVIPPFPCPTGEVYRAWDRTSPQPARGRSQKLVDVLEKGQKPNWADLLGNDLEAAAFEVQPQLAEIANALKPLGPVLLCGSGSTLSCWSSDLEAVQKAVEPWQCQVVPAKVTGEVRK